MVEEVDESTPTAAQNLINIDQSTVLNDLQTEDEKLTEALRIAMEEISQAKDEKRADLGQDDEEPEAGTEVPTDKKALKEKKKKIARR